MNKLPAACVAFGVLAGVAAAALPVPDADNGGLELPPGFRALIVADNLMADRPTKNDQLRFLAVAPNGDLYAKTYHGGIIALRDTNGDGRFEDAVQMLFQQGDVPGTTRDAVELPFEDAHFDVVWAGEVIEHVADTSRWLSELRRVLRSGGALLISTPDHGMLSRLRLALSRSAFEERFDPRSDHLRFYTRRALVDIYVDFGFEDVEVLAAGGFPGARRVLLASGLRSRF